TAAVEIVEHRIALRLKPQARFALLVRRYPEIGDKLAPMRCHWALSLSSTIFRPAIRINLVFGLEPPKHRLAFAPRAATNARRYLIAGAAHVRTVLAPHASPPQRQMGVRPAQ